MNLLAMLTENEAAINQVYNTAVGDRTTLLQLIELLKKHLAKFDAEIANVDIVLGPNRIGDIPHSLAAVEKAKELLGYEPTHKIEDGVKEAISWYVENLK
jgi:UDP-N-acetylglucosamine 4-epimerase